LARWKARLHALAAPGTGGPGRFRGQFARHARSWLSEARTGLFPELSQRLPGTAILRWLTDDRNAAIGPPGATYAVINVCREASPFRGTSTVLYSPRAWQHLLATMASVYPFDVRFMMMPLDEAGRLVDSRAAVVAAVSRDQADPRWVRFVMRAPKDLISWGRSKVQEEWIQFAESWAGQLDACYGHLSDDADDAGSVLEMATQTLGIDPPTVPRCREVLRGYSWVTVCAPELAQRLGGVPALTASGAFHQVRELPGGQILLRATPRLEQYKGAAVERVFRTLAPVLLTGRTARDRAPVLARLVLAADAADHRLAGSPAKIKRDGRARCGCKILGADPVPLENRVRLGTCCSSSVRRRAYIR
jgi:hypothetical protein